MALVGASMSVLNLGVEQDFEEPFVRFITCRREGKGKT